MIYVYRYEIAAVIITFAVMISLFRKKIISTKTVNTFSTVNFQSSPCIPISPDTVDIFKPTEAFNP